MSPTWAWAAWLLSVLTLGAFDVWAYARASRQRSAQDQMLAEMLEKLNGALNDLHMLMRDHDEWERDVIKTRAKRS